MKTPAPEPSFGEKYTINTRTALICPYHGGHEIGQSFEIVRHTYLVVTKAQAESFERVIEQQGRKNYVRAWMDSLDKHVMIQFAHIFIGIEPDGYAHS
jgi:hypothetical protein